MPFTGHVFFLCLSAFICRAGEGVFGLSDAVFILMAL